MRRRLISRLLLLLLAAALVGPAAGLDRAAAQQQTPFAVDVHAGYDGAYRLGEWFPVVVSIGNDGPDTSGVLEWNFPGQLDEQVFRRTIELPRGSRKRVVLEVFARGFARNGQIRLLDGDTVLLTQDINLESVDQEVFLAGVVSSDPAMLNSLASRQIAGFSNTQIRHLDAGDLPEHPAMLRGINALFLHDLDSTVLSPAQRETLTLWVSLGGQLVVSGGPNGQKAAAGLADLLPVDISGALIQGDITSLAGLAGAGTQPLNTTAPLNQAQPRPTAEQLPPNTGLLFRWRYGAGVAIFSAFDFASLRGWTGEGPLWGSVLEHQLVRTPGYSASLNEISLLERGVLRLRSLPRPSAGMLLAFLLAYVLMIGPLNYFVLRRLRRLEWAWLTMPLVVLLFSAGLYLIGASLRGGQSQFNQAAIVQGAEGQPRGIATAFIGLFSPRRASYTVGFPAATLVGGAPRRFSAPDQSEPIVADDTGARSMQVLADIGSVTTFVAEQVVDMPVSIQSNLTSDAASVHGEVRNTGPAPLEDVLLVRGDSFVRLGSLAPGATLTVGANSCCSLQQGFPSSVGLAASAPFDRQEMLRVLFDRDIARLRNSNPQIAGLNEDQGIYLLAWSKQPTVAATMEGREATQTGVTLYVIRLKSGSVQ